MNVALYGRVSSLDQAERQTIDAQKDFLRDYARLYGIDIAGEYYDEAVPGDVPLHERPEGLRMLIDAQAGRFSMVLVFRVDRLGRSLRVLLEAHKALEAVGVSIRSASEPFDTSTPIGNFLFQLLGSLSEMERATITERMSRGRRRVAQAGQFTGGVIPFGYDVHEDQLVLSRHLVPGTELTEAELVRSIFQNIATGGTLLQECRRLNDSGIPSIKRFPGGKVRLYKSWREGRISKMLRNTTYIGQAVYDSEYGAISRSVPALVTKDIWDQAHRQLKKNLSRAKEAARFNLLRGMIRCALCRAVYTAGPMAEGRYYYRCSNTSPVNKLNKQDRCKAAYVRAEWVEGAVWEYCRQLLTEPEVLFKKSREYLSRQVQDSPALDLERQSLQAELGTKAQERDRVTALFRKGLIDLSEAEAQYRTIDAEVVRIRTRLQAIQSREELVREHDENTKHAVSVLKLIAGRYNMAEVEADPKLKRQVIETLVLVIFVFTEGEGRKKKAKVKIVFRGGSEAQSIPSDQRSAPRSAQRPAQHSNPCPAKDSSAEVSPSSTISG